MQCDFWGSSRGPKVANGRCFSVLVSWDGNIPEQPTCSPARYGYCDGDLANGIHSFDDFCDDLRVKVVERAITWLNPGAEEVFSAVCNTAEALNVTITAFCDLGKTRAEIHNSIAIPARKRSQSFYLLRLSSAECAMAMKQAVWFSWHP